LGIGLGVGLGAGFGSGFWLGLGLGLAHQSREITVRSKASRIPLMTGTMASAWNWLARVPVMKSFCTSTIISALLHGTPGSGSA